MNIGKKESVQQFEGQALFIIVASVSINGGVLRHFRWKKELDLTLYMRTISLITSDICLKKMQM